MAASAGPRLLRLRLADFRNYPALDLACGAMLTAFVGPNGAGKTNILEAIALLSPGRGLRRAALDAIPRQGGSGGFSVFAEFATVTGPLALATALQPGEVQRQCRIDRAPVPSANRFLDHLALLWLTPDQDGLFRGPPGDRRRFLDRLVLAVDAAHGTRAGRYEQALRHRNRLLEEGGGARWLDAIEQEIAELGTALAAARVETVRRLAALAGAPAADPAFPHAQVALTGEIETRLLAEPAGAVEDWFRAALAAHRSRDRAAGRALVGPQVADLLVVHGPKNQPAAQCSTGEQKALLIGLLLAQAGLIRQMRGAAPLLLLDELAAHLDPERRAALFRGLERLGGQVFMTGTDPQLFAGLGADAALLAVAEGRVGRL
ncbi:DNA replication/repair protein RecF [Rhabdaerophilum calidifontis]|uniref:DNA replication/repair protein RecF n=1 Tax=Rhabdaerophilum calidifontis TaxID=2604328 RepID=UPI00123A7433|nr:DNA replication/repair protein RecF [Rhabdaerophilum calidifontis]